MSYVGLHTHSDYSLLDGASQLPQLIERAAELGMEAIALTDHGVMYGALQLIKLCRNKNIKPIIGNEMYVVNGDLKDPKIKRKKYHQIVLAKHTEGYKNLVKLTTISHLEGYQGKGIFGRPCINKEILEQYRYGLIVTSGCMAGEVPQNILKGELDEARKVAKWYKKMFGDDYYLEIQDHGYPEDRIINVAIVKIAKELNIKIIATNDSHFTNCKDVDAHDALLCINTQKLITEEKRMRYSGTEYLKSAEEMKMLFRDHLEDEIIEEAIANTLEVAAKVKSYDLFGDIRIPNYPIPSGHNPETYLEKVSWEGLQERLKVKEPSDISRQYPQYEERLKYELSMIEKMGFSTYFLVVWDYIKFARDNNIPVGPGRGSAAGSLVAYALKITNIDPVHHGLLFERFLNPERKSMPDIDTDFSIDRRDDMIKYVTERYGEDKVAQIITFNRMTSKAVLKDVARVLGIPYGEADKMAKMIPVSRGKPAKLKVMISEETPAPEFKEAYDQKMVSITDAKGESAGEIPVRQWIDMAIGIEGTNRTFGVHAAGVLISKDPLDEIVPLQRNNEGAVITQYFMEDLENLGLLKMDFLGLKNLTIIQKTAEAISQNHKIVLDPEGLPADERKAMDILAKGSQKKLPDDVKNTYKLIASGDLEGVFQLESSGMVDVVRKLKPSSIEDISSILALYRPGPLDAGLIPKFIDRKHGREEIKYDHALLEPILNETYGVLCYQEQIMKMAQDLAGYSLGQADLLRRCLSGDTTVVDVATGNLVKIAEIADRPEYWLGRKLFSLDLNSQEIVEQPISEIHRNGRRLVWEITTRTNRKIKATQEHLFYTVLGWKPLSVLQKGDRLGLAKRLPIINAAEISDAQIKLSAYLIGDGHLSTKAPSSSYFCNSDEELIDDFNRCATELFGSPAPTDTQLHPGRKSVTYARIGFISAFNHWVDNHLKRARSEHKEIPSWVFSLSQKQLQLFLGTLWSTDGSFDKAIGHADYTSTSPVLIKQIQHLFLRLGIVALFNTKKTSYKGKPYLAYRSQITGREDMLKFCELIQPYLSSYKQQLCQASYLVVKDKLQNQSKHSIPPEIITLIGESKKASGLTWEQIDITAGVSMSSGLNFQKTPTRSLFRHRVRNFATAFQDEKLMAIAESDVFWDEIISIEYVGVEEVFDLSIPHTHNFIANDFVVHNCMGKKKVSEMEKHREMFVDGATKKGVSSKVAQNLFEQMVKFAEYCFNKSHSTAYAYVSYQTAYLKANYPVEYMAALLTANSSDQDKVQKYIANCQRFNIEVEPPDINRSKVDFTPLPKSASGNGNGKILFGLSAVKNLGETAIMEILSAREKKGPFASLAELCDRVNQQALNKRALESLIYCGAFDKLEPNRKKLIAELQDVIDWAQKRQRDRDSGQLNLFDLGIGGAAESENGFESAPQKTGIADYTAKEKLNKEKELLGFYVSDHPLKCILQANPVEDALTIAELKDQETKPKGVVKVVAMVASQKLHTTKKGDRMAFVQIEDMTGQMEAIIFPNAFEEVRSVLNEENAILLLTGKAETKDEEVQLLVEGAKAIREEMAEAVEKSYPLNIEEEAIATSSTSPIELAPVAVEAAEIETPPESEHPAKLARQARRDPSVVLVGSLEDKGEKVTVKAIGKLTRVKVITTKKGDEMAFIEIEDETGKVDVTVFPKTYDRFKHLLEEEGEETLLLVTGKTEKREDRMKLTADKLELVGVGESSGMPSPPEEYFPQTYSPPLPPEEYFEESYSPPLPPEEYFEESYSPPPPSERFVAKTPLGEKMIVIQLTLEEVADRKNLDNLKMVLQEYAAKPESALLPVAAMVVGKSCRQLVRFDRRFWVETPDVIERLKGHSLNASMSNI